ncbi:MAG: alpha/beta hydrolase [Thermodesulfobacteriota bacterium]
MADFFQIDNSPLLKFLFYPRGDFAPCPEGAFDFFVEVEAKVSVHCRFYQKNAAWPSILYFHGNGEIVSDHDEIAPWYHRIGVNLIVADYRGYGKSTGHPNFSNLIKDAHQIFQAVHKKLEQQNLFAGLWIMGRSMGSVAALELGYHYPTKIKGMIIESGFASVTRLIRHLGLPAKGLDLEPIEKERLELIRRLTTPALIIHGEYDNLIPLREAQDLFALLGSPAKELVIIPKADHNNILFTNLDLYFDSLRNFIFTITTPSPR